MSPVAPAPEALLRAAARLLRPLVRLMLRSGVTFPVFMVMMRGVFVDVARSEILTDPDARTDSRVSLITGVHRKELKRLRESVPAFPEPVVVTRTGAIIARWLGDPRFTDRHGKPLPLRRFGPIPSFEALVASVTRDVRPRTVLDELLEAGTVRLDGETVVLSTQAFVPRDDHEARVFYFGRNLHDHLAAAEANMTGAGAPPFLERAVHYDGLSPGAAARLEAAARGAATAMLLDVNRTALATADADDAERPAGAPTRRVNLGVYLYASDER